MKSRGGRTVSGDVPCPGSVRVSARSRAVLTVSGGGIRRVVSFGDPGLVAVFGFGAETMA